MAPRPPLVRPPFSPRPATHALLAPLCNRQLMHARRVHGIMPLADGRSSAVVDPRAPCRFLAAKSTFRQRPAVHAIAGLDISSS
ncbi:hypothetical protein VPH35_139577 [Triticum aestivum]